MDDKHIVAIEIGSSKIRGALALIDNTGVLNILAVQEERIAADSVRYGQVKNTEEVSEKIDSICSKLEKIRAIQPRNIVSAYVGLSGYTIGASLYSDTMNFESETDINLSTISQLKESIASRHNSKEIYEFLPYEYLVDNESTLNPVGRVGRSIKGTFATIEGSPTIKSIINRVFVDRLNMQVNGYLVSALAQANMVLTPEEKQLGCMFVDFGCETTTVLIFKKGVLRYMVTLPMGSRNITRDLVSLNYLEEHAESIIRSVGITSASDNATRLNGQHTIEQPESNSYISARAGEIIANVVANIEYAGLTPSDLPSGMIIVGGGSRLKGLPEMTASQSNMKVRIGTTPRNIHICDASISADDITDVVALLIAAADKTPVDCLSPVTTPEYPSNEGPTYGGGGAFDDENGISRIGRDDYDDDDVYGDDEEEYKPIKNSTKSRHEYDSTEPKSGGLISRIQDRLSKLFSDDEKDRYDNDDE